MQIGSSGIVSSVPAPPWKGGKNSPGEQEGPSEGVGERAFEEAAKPWPEYLRTNWVWLLRRPPAGPPAPQVLSRGGPSFSRTRGHSCGPSTGLRTGLPVAGRGRRRLAAAFPTASLRVASPASLRFLCGFRGTSSNLKESDGAAAGLSLPSWQWPQPDVAPEAFTPLSREAVMAPGLQGEGRRAAGPQLASSFCSGWLQLENLP